ncbi:hypothetical protein SAMN05444166_4928 [Singulisphaera sp. GP187]|uniref:CAAX prenyl protease-related protein n=1 Tax=Singulisphaera sp. GP187 TaxID=1882752 RepID=UPI0009263706|nr:CAAX prenyl protease-related protein [Singulisphaera sp. GP187]SIO46134.1 hypothetical protein SAMN05444166_4928 [Singulisphaera sp. GP187]
MTDQPAAAPQQSVMPYVIPMAGFLAITTLEGYLPLVAGQPNPTWYPILYAVKVVAVTALVWACRSTWRDLAPFPRWTSLALAIVVGLAIAALWVGLDGYYPELPFLGKRTSFDPGVLSPAAKWGFIAVRMLGLVVLVPIIEELFWRSFLMRWVIENDFDRVPIGRVTPLAAAVTSVCFGLAHPEWLPGVLTGLAWAWLLHATKSLSACVASHAVANLALGLYVIATGDWKYW